jgi:hypothetical protein
MMADKTKIAGKKTVDDWWKLRATLDGDPESWRSAFKDFFYERLRTRYFVPIKTLMKIPDNNGEGFSIVAIQCSLIEFLGATLEGKSFRHRSEHKGGKPGDDEYNNSKDMFVSFLTSAVPFKSTFDENLAREFYTGVRCGLLHEARTKNGWTITAKSGVTWIVDTTTLTKKVHRDNLQEAFCNFVQWYREALPNDKKLQEAFIRKFDSLCKD